MKIPMVLCPINMEVVNKKGNNKMTKIELVQKIGDMVCPNCGPYSDCGIDPKECEVITNACNLLDNYVVEKRVDELTKEYLRKQEEEIKNGSLIGFSENALSFHKGNIHS